jgi:hypothetical protein
MFARVTRGGSNVFPTPAHPAKERAEMAEIMKTIKDFVIRTAIGICFCNRDKGLGMEIQEVWEEINHFFSYFSRTF